MLQANHFNNENSFLNINKKRKLSEINDNGIENNYKKTKYNNDEIKEIEIEKNFFMIKNGSRRNPPRRNPPKRNPRFNPIISPKKKSKRTTRFNPMKNNDPINFFDLIIGGDGILEEEEDKDLLVKPDNGSCPNPLCDHKRYIKGEPKDDFESRYDFSDPKIKKKLKKLDGLIELGKLYHCKKRKFLHGINLRVLCKLVEPLTELKSLIGMRKVKRQVVDDIISMVYNSNRNITYEDAFGIVHTKKAKRKIKHIVITGPPGVGKTELGKIFGKIYASIGLLSKGHVRITRRSKLIGKYLGHTAVQTQEEIDACEGGVMILDEGYSLGSKENRDSFAKECIDTLVQNLTEKLDWLCIIIGYKQSIEDYLFAQNEGLKSRFPINIDINNYSSKELMEIFIHKIKKERMKHSFKSKKSLTKFFRKNKSYFCHFGRDIDFLLEKTIKFHSIRLFFQQDKSDSDILSLEDLKNGFKEYRENKGYNSNNYKEKDSMIYG